MKCKSLTSTFQHTERKSNNNVRDLYFQNNLVRMLNEKKIKTGV